MDLMIFEVPETITTRCAKLYNATHVQRYLGTVSDSPGICDFLDNTVLYQAWEDLSKNWTQADYDLIRDVTVAKNVIHLLAQENPEKRYRIVELTLNDSKPEIGSRLIGYDVSICYFLSLIYIAFIAYEERSSDDSDYKSDWPQELINIEPLIDLTMIHFCQKLNSDGLFTTYSDAEFFLECMRALNSVDDNLWESPELMAEFEVTGLYEVNI